jgi:hypothetical protein
MRSGRGSASTLTRRRRRDVAHRGFPVRRARAERHDTGSSAGGGTGWMRRLNKALSSAKPSNRKGPAPPCARGQRRHMSSRSCAYAARSSAEGKPTFRPASRLCAAAVIFGVRAHRVQAATAQSVAARSITVTAG